MSLQDDFSSKLKRVFVELHNYSYYHGPSDDKQPDSRFIGRKRQREKLRSVLTDTEKNSGTYLITGYRGMGKTSFVNKVIESIYTPVTLFSRLVYLIFMHLLIFTICTFILFDFKISERSNGYSLEGYSKYFLILLILAAAAYIFKKYKSRYILIKVNSKKHLQWFEWFLLIVINFSIVNFIFLQSGTHIGYASTQSAYFNSLLFLLGFIGCVRLIIPLLKKKRPHDKPKNLFNAFTEKTKQFINYSDRINIKLNLGHSNLQEIDILRLIARNIFIGYKKYRRTYTFNWFIRAFLILGILIFTRISWELYSTNQSYYSFLQNTGISTICPSQQKLFLNRDSLLMFTYNKLQNNGKYTVNDYLSYTHFLNFNCEEKVSPRTIENYIFANEVDNFLKISKFNDPTNFPPKFKAKIKAFQNLQNVEEKVLALTCYADYALFVSYSYVVDFTYLNRIRLLPDNLHYLFFIYFVFLLLIFRLCSRLSFHNKTSRIQVIRNLRFLNELIDSHVSKDTTMGVGFIQSRRHIFSKNKSLRYERADVREIEKRLIEIIDDINELPVYSFRAKFTIVFDELDKIESYLDPQDKKERQGNGENSQTPESIRKRLQTVMELLSNLKYFLSTAQAKFIFIAGRELYDASLADVSDRNFRLGSIFHDVIYLNSFFTDLDKFGIEDITSRTEQYICRFLFPVNYMVDNYTLKEYNKYLLEKFPEFNEARQEEQCQKLIARQKREKIIYLLQQFIVYLNHISAGAPSKITTYFENYIITPKSVYNFNKNSGLLVGKENSTQYLFFDFYHQYKIGVFDYLLTPFNFSINKVIKNYGDKLIISASFLHDHMLKFHRNAFSWRDLEATPEMIDVNKNPELRDFLGIVMDYMLKTHIQEILNGLYDFKFPKKVSQEINYLSHVSEEASAIFNFTLDESLAIKQHFLNKLTKLEKDDNGSEELKNNYQFAKSSIYLTIGDLCFYDEDLGDAMVNYLEAINSIRNLEVEKLSITQMAILTRNMLKLGHTLEKRRTYDVAYLTYNEIWEKICTLLNYRYRYWSNDLELRDALDNIKYFYQPLLAKLHLTEKTSLDGINDKDLTSLDEEFTKIYDIIKTKNKHNILVEFWNKAGDILYYKYATNCKCSDEEFKNHICGKLENQMKCFACRFYTKGLDKLLSQHITNPNYSINEKLKHFLNPDYKNKNSDQDESKNKNINQHESKVLAMTFSDLGDVFLGCSDKKVDTIDLNLIKYLKTDKTEYTDVDFLEGFEKKNNLDKMLIYYHLSANFYKKSGDDKNFAFQYTKILYFIKEYAKRNEIQADPIKTVLNEYVGFIASQSIASIYKAYDYIHSVEISRFKSIFNSDDDYLIHKEVSLNMGSVNAEIDEIVMLFQKINLRLNKKLDHIYCPLTSYGINNNMYNRFLKLKLKAEINKKYFENIVNFERDKDLFEYIFDHPCDKTLTDEVIRTFIAKINENAVYEIFEEETTAQDALEFCITDSIFCYFEMLKIYNTFGVSFHLNYSTLAEIHEKLYIWSELYNFYCIMGTYSKFDDISDIREKEAKIQNAPVSIRYHEKISSEIINLDKSNSIVTKLKNLIEPDNLPSISAVYHCEKAAQASQLAIETHNEGKAYRDLLENMYYLNDDYNDKLYHFSVALERYKINLSKKSEYEQRIVKLKERMEKSSIYPPRHYTKTFI